MKNKYCFVVLFLFLSSSLVSAYEQPTHIELSKSAVKKTKVAMDATLLSDLGLESYLSNETFQNPDKPNDTKSKRTIIQLIYQGADFEDNFPRSLVHFYDPVNNKGMGTSIASPDWALEDVTDVNSGVDGPQDYSYKDAKQYFYLALTSQTEQERSKNWGKTFQTLGQVIHHMQDMSQPEHVRNDGHCDHPLCIALGRYDPSYYEFYSNTKYGDSNKGLAGVALNYPIPTFPTAREFWTTRATEAASLLRKGIADFTNRNFVSNNTNFYFDSAGLLLTTDYHYPQPKSIGPPRDIADADVFGAAGQTLCTKLKQTPGVTFGPGNCFIHFVSTDISGAIGGENPVNERAASYSLFDKKLKDYDKTVAIHHDSGDYIAQGIFTLNALNYDAAHNYLIPRAVSYSAGLINHFFRGKMQISLPDAGVYGLVDKSTLPAINLNTSFIGFSKIKFKVANTTPPLPGQSVPEAMNNGTLEAVIKFPLDATDESRSTYFDSIFMNVA